MRKLHLFFKFLEQCLTTDEINFRLLHKNQFVVVAWKLSILCLFLLSFWLTVYVAD